MNTKTRTTRQQSTYTTKKDTYQAKLETLRRKEVRNHKQSFSKARSTK